MNPSVPRLPCHQGQCNTFPTLWNCSTKIKHSLCHLKLRGNCGNKTQQSTMRVRTSRVVTDARAMTMIGKDEIMINTKRARVVRAGTNTRATILSLPACHNLPCMAQTMPSLRACTIFDQTLLSITSFHCSCRS